jgi:hypothetical protein
MGGVDVANYEMSGHRFTMVLVKHEGTAGGSLYRRAEFDLVRFNVDVDPDAPQEIVPVGATDKDKIFEHIWKTENMPFAKKTSFEG